jgi:hypothetical protein
MGLPFTLFLVAEQPSLSDVRCLWALHNLS